MPSITDIPVGLVSQIQLYAGSSDIHTVMADYHNKRSGKAHYDESLGGLKMVFSQVTNPTGNPNKYTNIRLTSPRDLRKFENAIFLESIHKYIDFIPASVRCLTTDGPVDPRLDFSRISSIVIRNKTDRGIELPANMPAIKSLVVYKCNADVEVSYPGIVRVFISNRHAEHTVAFSPKCTRMSEITLTKAILESAKVVSLNSATFNYCTGTTTLKADEVIINGGDLFFEIDQVDRISIM